MHFDAMLRDERADDRFAGNGGAAVRKMDKQARFVPDFDGELRFVRRISDKEPDGRCRIRIPEFFGVDILDEPFQLGKFHVSLAKPVVKLFDAFHAEERADFFRLRLFRASVS